MQSSPVVLFAFVIGAVACAVLGVNVAVVKPVLERHQQQFEAHCAQPSANISACCAAVQEGLAAKGAQQGAQISDATVEAVCARLNGGGASDASAAPNGTSIRQLIRAKIACAAHGQQIMGQIAELQRACQAQ